MRKQRLPGRREVVLIAHEPPNSEHLGIRLVAAGLAEAGFHPRVLSLLTPSSLAAMVGETLAAQPFLVGVSISDAMVAPPLLAFVRLLRQSGFAGHITAGGALATLERTKLLAAHPAIDSVVRHAGEAVIVELAHALAEGRGLHEIPGLTTRLGDGRGNPHAFTPSRLRPLRAHEPPTLIGIPKADIAASRGCAGRCAYCGVSALERDLDDERKLLGLDAGSRRGRIQRPVDDLADEVAALYHDRSVRVVQLVDDNLLGPDPRAARAWLLRLEAALRQRHVGKMAWRLMAEPSVISDEVADAFARLGVLNVLVGIESLTPAGKAALGRPGRHERRSGGLAPIGAAWNRADAQPACPASGRHARRHPRRARRARPARRIRVGRHPARRVARDRACARSGRKRATGGRGRGASLATSRAGGRAFPVRAEPAAHGWPGMAGAATECGGRAVRVARGAPPFTARGRAGTHRPSHGAAGAGAARAQGHSSSRRLPWPRRRFPRASSVRQWRRWPSRHPIGWRHSTSALHACSTR